MPAQQIGVYTGSVLPPRFQDAAFAAGAAAQSDYAYSLRPQVDKMLYQPRVLSSDPQGVLLKDPLGTDQLVQAVAGYIRKVVQYVLEQAMDRVFAFDLGGNAGFERIDLGQEIGPELRGLTVPEHTGQAQLESLEEQSFVDAYVGKGSRIDNWIDKVLSFGNKVSDIIDWAGEKKDQITSTITRVWDGVSGIFG